MKPEPKKLLITNKDLADLVKLPNLHNSAGEKAADVTARGYGSWRFIIIQASLMACWVVFNTIGRTQGYHFDEFPFVFLNLAMSAEAAFATPIILMAQNRAAEHQQQRTETLLGALQKILISQNAVLDYQNTDLNHQDEVLAHLVKAAENQDRILEGIAHRAQKSVDAAVKIEGKVASVEEKIANDLADQSGK